MAFSPVPDRVHCLWNILRWISTFSISFTILINQTYPRTVSPLCSDLYDRNFSSPKFQICLLSSCKSLPWALKACDHLNQTTTENVKVWQNNKRMSQGPSWILSLSSVNHPTESSPRNSWTIPLEFKEKIKDLGRNYGRWYTSLCKVLSLKNRLKVSKEESQQNESLK